MSATPAKAKIANTGAEFHRLRNIGAAILTTTAINSPIAAAVTPVRMRLKVSIPPKRSYKIASTMTISSGGPSRPASATAAPAGPPKREPNTTEKLITLGPGKNCDSAKVSLNSSAVIQRFFSTMARRAHGSAPPKPETDTSAKARNSSVSDGCMATDWESDIAKGVHCGDAGDQTLRADPTRDGARGEMLVSLGPVFSEKKNAFPQTTVVLCAALMTTAATDARAEVNEITVAKIGSIEQASGSI